MGHNSVNANVNSRSERDGTGVIVLYVPRPPRLSSLDRAAADVWMALCSFAEWDAKGLGSCSPSLTELAAAAPVSVRTASKGLSLLAGAGLVRIQRVMSGGRILRTRYTLVPEPGMDRAA